MLHTDLPISLNQVYPAMHRCLQLTQRNDGRFLWYCPNVIWSAETIAPLTNIVIPFCAFFVIQDGFYTVFHWLLHKPALYPYIHKHHVTSSDSCIHLQYY